MHILFNNKNGLKQCKDTDYDTKIYPFGRCIHPKQQNGELNVNIHRSMFSSYQSITGIIMHMHYQHSRLVLYLMEWAGCGETIPVQLLVLSFYLSLIRERTPNRHDLTNTIHLWAASRPPLTAGHLLCFYTTPTASFRSPAAVGQKQVHRWLPDVEV